MPDTKELKNKALVLKAFDAQDPDSFTTKGDYSADVLARAASFEEALS